jgi:hypothetical protein
MRDVTRRMVLVATAAAPAALVAGSSDSPTSTGAGTGEGRIDHLWLAPRHSAPRILEASAP